MSFFNNLFVKADLFVTLGLLGYLSSKYPVVLVVLIALMIYIHIKYYKAVPISKLIYSYTVFGLIVFIGYLGARRTWRMGRVYVMKQKDSYGIRKGPLYNILGVLGMGVSAMVLV